MDSLQLPKTNGFFLPV